MKARSEIFYNYLLRVEYSEGRFLFRLLTETGRTAAEGSFTLPPDFTNIDRMLPSVAQAKAPSSVLSAVEKLGKALYRSVFTSGVRRELMRIIDVGGIISLAVATHSRRVASLPWEAMHDGTEPLMRGGQIIVCRSAEGFSQTPIQPVGETPRVMVMALLPPEERDLALLQKRIRVIWNTLSRFEEDGIIDLTMVAVKSISEARDVLNAYMPHILCFISLSAGSGILLSTAEMVTANKVVGVFLSSSELRCVLLISPPCEQMTFFDIAWQLVNQGIPFVATRRIALDELTEELYLSAFFENMLRGSRADVAHFAGSSALVSDDSIAYISPVLFASSTDPILPKLTDEELARRKEESLRRKSASSSGIDRARLLLSLALHHFSRKHFSEAIEVLNDAMEAYEEGGDEDGLRHAIALSAACYAEEGNLDSASSSFNRLLEKYPDRTDRLQIFIFDKLGFILLRKNDLHGALNAFREALRLNTKVKDREYLVATSLGLGETFLALGSVEEAISTLQKGAKIAEQSGSTALLDRIKPLLATVLLHKGSYQQAYELFSEMLGEGDESSDIAYVALCRLGAAVSAMLSNDENTAQKWFAELSELLKEHNMPEINLATLFNLATFSIKTLAYEDALYYILRCHELAAKMGRGDIVQQLKRMEEKIRTKVGPEIYTLYLSSANERLTRFD